MDCLNSNKQFWEQVWAEGRIGFHRSEVHPSLARFAGSVFAPSSRLLVPLCGKSLDMLWLCERSFGVTGVELSHQALQEFITENQLSGVWENQQFQVKEKRLSLHCQDFFHHEGRYEGIYDRACLVALAPALRVRMSERYHQLLVPGGKILLMALTHTLDSAPPHSVSPQEVEELFAEKFTIKQLETSQDGIRQLYAYELIKR